MKENGKAWLMALFMGILLPALLSSSVEKMIGRNKPDGIVDQTIIATEQTALSVKEEISVPVLMSDGNISKMPMGKYLIGVLLGEMPADFDMEALKAQAVVARTYALKRNSTGQKHKQGAVCLVSSCCQAYCSEEDYLASKGSQESVKKVIDAVTSTEGQVLTYQGALIEATYFSCSGGRTEDAQAVWGTDIPYLQAVDSPGEENATYYKETISISAQELAAKLGISVTGNPSNWFGPVTYTSGGGVDTMTIAGKTFQGTDLRQKLDLRSTAFSIMPVGDKLLIQTRGFGHRVGMSQYGAEAMAVSGNSYAQILQHYYPGTVLVSNFYN